MGKSFTVHLPSKKFVFLKKIKINKLKRQERLWINVLYYFIEKTDRRLKEGREDKRVERKEGIDL